LIIGILLGLSHLLNIVVHGGGIVGIRAVNEVSALDLEIVGSLEKWHDSKDE
jgi:hypothetical protein